MPTITNETKRTNHAYPINTGSRFCSLVLSHERQISLCLSWRFSIFPLMKKRLHPPSEAYLGGL